MSPKHPPHPKDPNHPATPARFAKTRLATAVAFAGLVSPLATVQAASPPDGDKKWTHGTTEAANKVVGSRSGISFGLTAPPEVSIPATLTLTLEPSTRLNQVVEVLGTPPEVSTPDPAVQVMVAASEPGVLGTVELRVLNPDAVTIYGPDGRQVGLCSAAAVR